jgi:hypothetical protein
MSAEERAAREEANRPFVSPSFVDLFDTEFYEEFGRFPAGSPRAGTSPASSRRRTAIQALIDRGATEGERDAARAAMERLDAQDEADYEDALAHGEA